MLSSDSTSVLSGKSIGKLHLNTSHFDNGPLSIQLKRICCMKFLLIFKHFENGCSETSLCTPPSICENPHAKYYLLIMDSITAIPLFNSLFSIHVSLIRWVPMDLIRRSHVYVFTCISCWKSCSVNGICQEAKVSPWQPFWFHTKAHIWQFFPNTVLLCGFIYASV